jgi:4-hydroxy-2-oxoheptanedioate aldolase
MIEDVSAIADIDAVVGVPGVDIVVVGPSDLSASLGVVGLAQNEELAAAIERVFTACRSAGVKFGIPAEHAAFPKSVSELRDKGAWFLASGSDATFLLGGWRSLVKRLRGA